MASEVQFHPGDKGRKTFASSEDFQKFLGLLGGPSGDYPCMVWITDAKKNNRPCGRPRGVQQISEIKIDSNRFIQHGFPSPEAEQCMWHIVFNSICGHRTDRHQMMVRTVSSRVTQYQHLYTRWHESLWTAYLKEHNPGAIYLAHRDITPPPLSAEPEIWRDRATARKPPLIRALTASVASGTRLFGRLFAHRQQRLAKSKRQGSAIQPNTDVGSSNFDTPNRDAPDSLRPNKLLNVAEGLSSQSTKPEKGPTNGDVEVPAINPRPPLTRNPSVHRRTANYLILTPDSSPDTTLASSVFSKEDEPDTIKTPFSDTSLVPSAQSHDSPGRRSAGQDGHSTPTRVRRPAPPDLVLSHQTAETGEADLILYYRIQEDQVSSLRQKLQKAHSDIKIEVQRREPGATQAKQREFKELEKKAKASLHDMFLKLHEPILDERKSKRGWLYGFTFAGYEGKYIKIGVSNDVEGRLKNTGVKCKDKPIELFRALMPCAAAVMERLLQMHLYKQRRRTSCTDGCGSEHQEWFEITLEEALDSILKWMAFSKCKPYENRCLVPYWHKMTVRAWDDQVSSWDPAKWVDTTMCDTVCEYNKERENKGQAEAK